MKPVGLGVIGCGVVGNVHLQGATQSPLIDVVALADLREKAAREAAEKFGVRTVYADADALLDDSRVEAVILAMPACHRTALALRAFAKGKHVLTEKPAAMNAGEVQQMIDARGELTAGCCSARFRLFESADAVTKLIAGGALGKLRVVRCRGIDAAGGPPKSPPPAWRLKRSLNGGGIMVNWGCYDLDYLMGVTGWTLKPQIVLAQTWTVPPQYESYVAPGSDAETHGVAMICCAGGTVITLERGEKVAARTEKVWQIIGTSGSLQLSMLPGQGRKVIHDAGSSERGVVSKTIWEGDEDTTTIAADTVNDFAAAIRDIAAVYEGEIIFGEEGMVLDLWPRSNAERIAEPARRAETDQPRH